MAVIDVASRKLLRTIEGVGTRPWGIALSADGSKLYTANGPSGDVAIVDVATGKVEKKDRDRRKSLGRCGCRSEMRTANH